MLWSQVSTILGSAIPEEREANHWIEGVAIWVSGLRLSLRRACPCCCPGPGPGPPAAEMDTS